MGVVRVFSFLVVLSAFSLFAQSPLGTITGIAADATSAPVPGASVTVASEETGVKFTAPTNASGSYSVPNLKPGRYRVTATAQGFRPVESPVITVTAYQTVRQDLHFEVASASTEITISDTVAPMLNVDSPSINERLSSRQILDLPTNLRSIYNNSGDSGLVAVIMPLTIPGVVQVGSGAAWLVPGANQNGMRLEVDGIETDFGNFGSPDPVSQPSMESVEEFSANILSNRAEFGRQGTVTSVTRSGTNAFHGSTFWYARNSALDARNAFSTTKPFQNIHDYGISGGGPLRKDKTFLYATFEGIRGVRAYLFSPNVPTLAMRQGDFTGMAALKNPFTGFNPFQGNTILPQYITPQAQKAQQLLFPLPNFGGPALAAGNYRANFNGPEQHHIFEVRLDHHFTARHSAFARYENKNSNYEIPGARSQLPPSSVGTSTNIRFVHFFTVGDVYSIAPNVYNEFRAGAPILVSKSDADVKGQPLIDAIGIQGLPSRQGIKGVPNITISGLTRVTQSLLNPVNDGHWQLSDNLTWVAGRHTWKFGGEFVHWFVNRYLPTDAGLFGNFTFNGRFTGNAYADFLLGLPASVVRLDPYPTQYNRFNDMAAYAQDDWKITPKLTLSYGIRYEYNAPVTAENDNLYSFDLATSSIVVPSEKSRALFSSYFPASLKVVTAGSIGWPRGLRFGDKNNFGPRLGFSYLITPKTVLRGGAGIYYAHFSGLLAGTLAAGPYAVNTTANNSFVNGQPVFTFQNPFAAPSSAGSLNITGINPHLKNPMTIQYNLTVERELGRDIGVRISYIGSKGEQLTYLRDANQPYPSTAKFDPSRRPYPQFSVVSYGDNGANSLYSGLQVQVQKRFSKGLTFSSAWTWAKELTEVDDTGNQELNTAIENAYDRRRDRGNAYSVPRHQWMNNALYDIPGKGVLLGGWQLNTLFNVSTGNWLNPIWSGVDPANINVTSLRPDQVKPLSYPKTISQWFDPSAYAVPPNGRFGNAARNSIEGPGYVILNAGLLKTLRFEKVPEVQLGASFQNVLNHVNLGAPSTTVSSPSTVGAITATHVFAPAGTARTGQLTLRFNW